eukprot:gene2678-2716_t
MPGQQLLARRFVQPRRAGGLHDGHRRHTALHIDQQFQRYHAHLMPLCRLQRIIRRRVAGVRSGTDKIQREGCDFAGVSVALACCGGVSGPAGALTGATGGVGCGGDGLGGNGGGAGRPLSAGSGEASSGGDGAGGGGAVCCAASCPVSAAGGGVPVSCAPEPKTSSNWAISSGFSSLATGCSSNGASTTPASSRRCTSSATASAT